MATARERTQSEPGGAADAAVPELELTNVGMTFQSRSGSTQALAGIDLAIRRQEFVAIVGQSGCGKTTLLRILAGLVRPTEGEVRTAGRPLWEGDTRNRETLGKLGLVFQ